MEYAHDDNNKASGFNNIQLYIYLKQIEKGVKPDDTDWVIKTEKHILSKNFTNQREFKDKDKESMIPIIRDYKLNLII